MHNLHFLLDLMRRAREPPIEEGRYAAFLAEWMRGPGAPTTGSPAADAPVRNGA